MVKEINILENIKIDKKPIGSLEKTISYLKNEIAIRTNKVYDLYNELYFAVTNKLENETRHETILRYIKEAECESDKVEIPINLLKSLRDNLVELINIRTDLTERDRHIINLLKNELKEVDKLLKV
jgi:hypothetical protein